MPYLKIVLTATLTFMLLVGCDRYVKYEPLKREWVRGEPRIVEAPARNTPTHYEAFREVMSIYDIDYTVRDGDIYIPRSLANNRDLLVNYSDKAHARTDE